MPQQLDLKRSHFVTTDSSDRGIFDLDYGFGDMHLYPFQRWLKEKI